MKQQKFAFALAWIAALLVATPAVGQLLNSPVQALPLGDAAGETFAGLQYARGLNDNSTKQSSVAVGVGRASEKVSFMGMGGYVATDLDELTLGAAVAYHMLSDPDAVQVSLQGGVGWASFDGATDNTTWMNFPIGVVIQAAPSGSATQVTPWVLFTQVIIQILQLIFV